jgi:hypothetical protein
MDPKMSDPWIEQVAKEIKMKVGKGIKSLMRSIITR